MQKKLFGRFGFRILFLVIIFINVVNIFAADNGSTKYGPTQADEHLWRIARKVNPDHSLTIAQVEAALLSANPDAFIDNDINRLKTGYTLTVPAADVIARIPADAADKKISGYNDNFKNSSAIDKSFTTNKTSTTKTSIPAAKSGKVVEPDSNFSANNSPVNNLSANNLSGNKKSGNDFIPEIDDNNAVATSDKDKNLSLSSRDLGILGPINIGGQYSDNYGYIMHGQLSTAIGPRNAISMLVEYGEDQARVNGTVGYAITDSNRIKISAERLWQNMDFAFDSGTVNERVAQDALGLSYEYLVGKGFWHDVNLNGTYSNVDNKDLGTVIFDDNGVLSENYRNIAGGRDKSLSLGVDVQPMRSNLLGVQLNYDNLTYDAVYDPTIENSKGFGATINLQQLLSDRLKLSLEASHRVIYDNYSAEISWLVPAVLQDSLTLGLAGSRIVGGDDLPDDTKVTVNLALQLDKSEEKRRHSINLSGIDDSIVSWTAIPAVYMNQVLAVVDQMTKQVTNPTVTIPDKLYVLGQVVHDDITSGISIGSSRLQSVAAPDLETYGLKANLSADGKTVTIDGNPNQIVAFVPILFTVVNNAGKTAETTFNLTINNTTGAPVIQSLSVTSGPSSGGFQVEIVGLNFVKGSSSSAAMATASSSAFSSSIVTFGGNIATNIVIKDSSHIIMNAPAHLPGVVDVVVINPDGQSGAKFGGFTYTTLAPIVSALLAANGSPAGGDYILVQGANFASGATVTLGGVPATDVHVLNFNNITLKTPAHAPGSVDVVVKNYDGTFGTLHNGFTYNANPVISSISPTSGSVLGGNTLTVFGSGFQNGSHVALDGVLATNTKFVNSGELQVVTPAHAAGKADVTVVNPDAQFVTLPSSYEYLNAPIGITSLSPTSGPADSDAVLTATISGQNFLSGATVTFGGVLAANIIVSAPGTITCDVPKHVAGAVDVVVTNPDGKSATSPNQFTYVSAPSISSILPTDGSINGNTHVTITGNNFQNGATVMFGGVAASVISVTPIAIECTTPPHAAGAVDIMVTNPDNQFATATNGFTFVPPPTISAVNPGNGSVGGKTQVVVSGANFIAGATVLFGANNPAVCSWQNSGILLCTTPAHALGSVDVTVINPDTDKQSAVLANGFTYINEITIDRVVPNFGSTLGGTLVTIYGSNFDTGTPVEVYFDNDSSKYSATSVSVVNANKIICRTPAHPEGTVSLSVKIGSNNPTTLANAFTYENIPVPTPVIDTINPNHGPVTGNTPVKIHGGNFVSDPLPTVLFGGTSATSIAVLDSGHISCATPSHAAGAVDVVVQNVGGDPATAANGYTYDPPPSNITVTPNHGTIAGNETVTVSGTGFQNNATVIFGGVSATVISITSTAITCKTPSHAAGVVDVKVTNPDGQSGTGFNVFTYFAPPSISTVSPTAGPLGGTGTATIKGANFISGATVTFGGTPATNPVVLNSNTITCTIPAHDAGTVDVVVTNPDGQSATKSNAYTYNPAPTITGLIPGSGSVFGGDTITITGSDFKAIPIVSFDGVLATNVTFVNSGKIGCTSPAHLSGVGVVTVRLTNPDGQFDTATYNYTGIAPVLTSISPDNGSTVGGNNVVFTGNYFTNGAYATFGTVNVACQFNSITQLVCKAPAHAADGDVAVTVTTDFGTSSALTYTYNLAPNIIGVNPNISYIRGGETVDVKGSNFASGAKVYFGGVLATDIQVPNSTNIFCTVPIYSGTLPHTVDVTVFNPNGVGDVLHDGFIYETPPGG